MQHIAEFWRRWRYSRARDAVTAVLLGVVLVSGSYGEAHPTNPADLVQFRGHHLPHTPDVALLLVAAACLVLAARHRYPVATLLASTACVVAYSLLGNVNGAALLAPAVALFAVGTTLPWRRALLLAGVTLVALMGATAAGNPFSPTGGGFFLIPALVAAPVLGGIAIANRRAYAASIQARAEDETRRRVDEERLRIARELHDIVAHSMATVSVQAGVAEHVLAANPAAAADALRAIRLASRDGLRELRAILTVLRQADEADPVEPAPGLAQVDALVDRACQAGLPTTVRQEGRLRPLPAGADLAAYRIIQESLTNVLRHAGPATATVLLRYDDDAIRIEVVDTGRGAAGGPGGSSPRADTAGAESPGAGHGLIGMRERAAAVGGTLLAGPGPASGYRVVAVLPWQAEPPGSSEEPAAEGAVPAEPGPVETGSRP